METLVPMLNDGWAPLFAARRLRDKYIEAPTPEYYDLSADPKELNNLQPNEPSAATELAAALGKMRAAFPEPSAKAARSLTREELASLAGLGYVSPAASQPSQPADPKSMVASLHERLVATDLLQRGRTAEAAAKLEALTKASPGSADLWLLLAQANERIGGLSAALPAARNAVSADPADPELWCALAAYQFAVGDVAKGETALARAERIDPNCGRVWMLRSWRAVQQRDLSEAMKLARRAAEVDAPRMGGEAFALIGRMHEHDGRMEEAQKAYEASLNFDPLNGASLLARAKIALRDDDANLAVMLLQGLVEWQPEFVEGGLILGRLFYQNKQPDIAERVYVKVLSVAPGNGLAHYEMARVLASQGKADEAIGHLEAAARTGQIDFASLRNDPGFAPIKDDPRVAELEATAASQQPAPSPAGPPSP
jgi:tetratricopeptide (TPR) repeat protein